MTAEQPFLDAIAANPQDWDLRSVYADWLEEQGRNSEAAEQRKIAFLRDRPALCTDFGGGGYVAKAMDVQDIISDEVGVLSNHGYTIRDLLLAGF